MLSILSMPSSTVADVMGASGTLFTDLWVLVAVAIGVPLAFYVIKRVIGLMPKARGTGEGGRRGRA